jgi:hypothetical protein
MDILARVDLAISEDRKARCLWAPAEHWTALCEQLGRRPNRIGVLIYRGKTIREGPPYSDVTTHPPDEAW